MLSFTELPLVDTPPPTPPKVQPNPLAPENLEREVRAIGEAMQRNAEARAHLASLEAVSEHPRLEAVQEAITALQRRHTDELAEVDDTLESRRQQIESEFRTATAEAEAENRAVCSAARKRFDEETKAVETKYEEDTWMMSSMIDDDSEDSPKRQYETTKAGIERTQERMSTEWGELKSLYDRAVQTLQDRHHWSPVGPLPTQPAPANREESQTRFETAAATARDCAAALDRQWLPKLCTPGRLMLITLALVLVIGGGVALGVDPVAVGLRNMTKPMWLIACGGVAFILCLAFSLTLWNIARRRSRNHFVPLQAATTSAHESYRAWQQFAKRELHDRKRDMDARYQQIVDHREQALKDFTANRDTRLKEILVARDETLRTSESTRQQRLRTAGEYRGRELARADADHERERRRLSTAFDAEHARLDEEREAYLRDQREQREECTRAMTEQWTSAVAKFSSSADAVRQAGAEVFPNWETMTEQQWCAAEAIPPGIQIGNYHITPNLLQPLDEEAEEEHPRFSPQSLPAVLPFPEAPSLLLKTNDGGRAEAVHVLQTAMLRMLTLFPPGTVRFTVLDPVGLGEQFSAFMHLADYDELMISNRIWTEPAHIDQQLANLTEHLENVFQKYLRNEFQSIEEYNRYAGEVAEPYRILVVTGFPSGFSERAASRLTSIATSGPRCGVYTLITADTRQHMPRDFNLSDLEDVSTVFNWRDGKFVRKAFGVNALPLEIEPPPAAGLFTSVVKKMGEASKGARRVEVPFHRIAPRDEDRWTTDSRKMLDVPLGRSGATKLEHLTLGVGTSQHALVAGRTGSGKSTLLHVLVTNAALRYGPDDLEFYLIDFKKGVEFKTYVTHKLPHARVVAIESDREFGVSALERLDGILKERGELFRERGVQDIAGFRNNNPGESMPRILLVVDEFQEFFIEDDRYAQTATLLLDRLVRQGRAFGIHVLLGSQTLGGAYSLARTTLSQMAVRIALQCSESDAHLILSEDNTAARLLARPGEAIYNDANGMLEGNSLFQVAWLGDDEHSKQLRRVEELCAQRDMPRREMVVFEGHIAANLQDNAALERRAGEFHATTEFPAVASGWVGEPVAIAGPTEIAFPTQSAANFLLVGPNAKECVGVLSAAVVGLATACPVPAGEAFPTIIVMDGVAPPADGESTWQQVANALPHAVRLASPNNAAAVMGDIAAELERRNEHPHENHPACFVVIADLGRFQDLRKAEDDFGFGSFDKDKPVSPGKLFTQLLQDGPGMNMHVLLWCTSYNTFDRWLGRQSLREFALRAAFQMSVTDSSQLIESPAASRLGPHRAILYRDDRGTVEKFRPYGVPSSELLETLADQLQGKPQSPPDELDEPDALSEFTVI